MICYVVSNDSKYLITMKINTSYFNTFYQRWVKRNMEISSSELRMLVSINNLYQSYGKNLSLIGWQAGSKINTRQAPNSHVIVNSPLSSESKN